MNSFRPIEKSNINNTHLVHVTDYYSEKSGGVAAVVDQLSQHLANKVASENIFCVRGNPISSRHQIRVANYKPAWGANFWGWSSSLEKDLSKCIDTPNSIVHIHGIWMAPQWLAAALAIKKHRPFVLSPHAMLEPWFWNNQGVLKKIKKEIYWKLFAFKKFTRNNVLHAITKIERDNLFKLFPQSRIEIIPNAIDINLYEKQSENTLPNPDTTILFLGRIHPQKGIDLLLKGFAAAQLRFPWKIIIAGPIWSQSYEMELRKLIHQLDISSQVEFIGPVFGEEKLNLLRRSWVVAVPSWTEVISMVNLEAAASLTPTITTRETGLDDWEEGGGVLIERSVAAMARALNLVCSWSISERIEKGYSSRSLVKKRYDWKVVMPKWVDLYQSLV